LELEGVRGIGPARAAQLAAAFELGRRSIGERQAASRWTIRAPRDVSDRLMLEMAPLEREQLRVLVLNAKNVVLRSVTVYQGNVSGALVRIAELFREAIRENCASLIIVHNHPSGDPTPSPEDVRVTSEAVKAGQLLDIEVLDHLIVGSGQDRFISLKERGLGFP
jgi:DNA repair protein RadC